MLGWLAAPVRPSFLLSCTTREGAGRRSGKELSDRDGREEANDEERKRERGSRGEGEGRGKAGSERGRKKRRRSLIDQRGNEGESSAATPGTRQRERRGSGGLVKLLSIPNYVVPRHGYDAAAVSQPRHGRRGRFLDGMETIGSGGEGKQTGSARDRQIERQTDGETAE